VLEEAGVAITPGLDFGSNRPERHVRFAYTRSLEDLEEGVEKDRADAGGAATPRGHTELRAPGRPNWPYRLLQALLFGEDFLRILARRIRQCAVIELQARLEAAGAANVFLENARSNAMLIIGSSTASSPPCSSSLSR